MKTTMIYTHFLNRGGKRINVLYRNQIYCHHSFTDATMTGFRKVYFIVSLVWYAAAEQLERVIEKPYIHC